MGIILGIYVLLVGILWVFLPQWRRELALVESRLVDARVQLKQAAPIVSQRAQTAQFLLWQIEKAAGSAFDLAWRGVVRAGAGLLVRGLHGRFHVRIWAVPLMRAVVRQLAKSHRGVSG